jgi:hypothetical protein
MEEPAAHDYCWKVVVPLGPVLMTDALHEATLSICQQTGAKI